MHANQITQWKSQLLERAASVFGKETASPCGPSVGLKELNAKIGEQALEINLLGRALSKAGLLSGKR